MRCMYEIYSFALKGGKESQAKKREKKATTVNPTESNRLTLVTKQRSHLFQ